MFDIAKTFAEAQPDATDLVAKAMREPLALSEAELAAVQVFDPAVTQLYPFAPVRNPRPLFVEPPCAQYSTHFAGGDDVGVAFRKVQHRVVQSGLNILITPQFCETIARTVCRPFDVKFDNFPDMLKSLGGFRPFRAENTSEKTTARIYASACASSPALGLQSYLAYLFIAQMRTVFLATATNWKNGSCPYLAQASQFIRNDLAIEFDSATMLNMAMHSPIIAADFQNKIQGTPEDLLITNPSIMRWIVNRFKENGAFSHRRTPEGRKAYTIDCPAITTTRAMLSGTANDGTAFGMGIGGLSAWLYTQRNEEWFHAQSAKVKEYFKDLQLEASASYDSQSYQRDRNRLLNEQFNYGHCRRVRGEARMAP